MLKKILLSALLSLAVVIAYLLIQPQAKTTTKAHKEKHTYPSEWFDYQRTYPYGKLNQTNYLKAMKQVNDLQRKSRTDIIWEFAGPTNIGGRISDIEIHPDAPATVYVGAASGGIFKTEDEGSTWQHIFSDVPTIGIGDIAIDPNNPNILYAGTGESNASSNTFLGSGIYKSDDAGENWEYIGLENSAYIGRLIVDYCNSSRIWAAACGNLFSKNPHRGIYRTSDGGTNWEQILFLTDSTSGIDIVQHPAHPDTLYAAMWERFRGLDYRRSYGNSSGIWKTVDGGDTWEELTFGLPTGSDVGRIGLSISESNPDVLYAIYDKSDYSCEVYKTVDGGDTWTMGGTAISGIHNTFGWYFGQIRVDPQNENRVFAMGLDFYRSEDGAASWIYNGDMHVDHHALEFTEAKIWCGNDGGLYFSSNSGSSWNKVNNLPLTQFYDIALDSVNTDRLYGGTQDNNSVRTATGNINDWEYLLGGDGMYCLVDYENPGTFYCEYQYGGMYRLENDGFDYYNIAVNDSRTNWSTPYVMHPENPNILYVGTYRIHKSLNQGDSWTPVSGDLTKGGDNAFHTITTLDISVLNPNILIVGTADGKVHITTNDGADWSDITNGLPDRWITRVKTDPFDVNTVYATVSGFRWDEHYSHIFKSTDLGQTWEAIDGNLPEIPINAMVLDPDIEGQIYIGTDAGVYMTSDSGASWECISMSIPNVPVMAMEFHHADRKLFIGTYGVSAYKAHIPLENIAVGEPAKEDEIRIYPNPAESGSVVQIGFNETTKNECEMRVTDISGKAVGYKKIIRNTSWRVCDQAGKPLPPGLYLLIFSANEQQISKKLVVR